MLECHQWLDEPLQEVSGQAQHALELTYELRTRSRLLTRSVDGVELGLFLPRGRVLQQGDRLLANDGSTVVIQAAPEPLTRVQCEDALLLARGAYHLGNRHVALEVQRGELRYLRDHVLTGMLKGLGLEPEDIVAPFNPESGAYHGHTHGSVATPAAPLLRLSGH